MARPAGARIQQEVGSWDGVTVAPHRFGGLEYRVGRRELGHVHGDRLADLPFPVAIRRELVAAGRAGPHHILPHSGWVSLWIRRDADVDTAIELFRLNYDRPWLARTANSEHRTSNIEHRTANHEQRTEREHEPLKVRTRTCERLDQYGTRAGGGYAFE